MLYLLLFVHNDEIMAEKYETYGAFVIAAKRLLNKYTKVKAYIQYANGQTEFGLIGEKSVIAVNGKQII